MILYTPLSSHDIFPENDVNEIVYHRHNNRTLKCKDLGDGRKQIIQLISTDPNDYLNPLYQPGQWLDS